MSRFLQIPSISSFWSKCCKCLRQLWHIGGRGAGDLPEERRSCQAGLAGPQCQGRGSQGLIHRRMPDITNLVKNMEHRDYVSNEADYLLQMVSWISIFPLDTRLPMLLITNHWMWWSCEDLLIILRDKSVKSPGGKQDHNGLRSTARSSGLRRRWSNEAIP